MKYTHSSLVFALMLGASGLSQAANLYVKTNGNNTKDCLSWDNACATIAFAAGKAAAGDEIRIAKGLYTLGSTISVSNKSLAFVGGFDVGAESPSGDKYSTVISGDAGTVDVGKTASGITKTYTDIRGVNISRAFNISTGNYRFERMTFTGFQGLAGASDDHHGTVIFYAGSSLPGNTLALKDVGVIGNSNTSMGVIMAYTSSPNRVFVEMDDVLCENNLGDGGVCLTLHSNAQGADIRNSTFKGNVSIIDSALAGWDNGIGVIWAQSASTLSVSNSLFANNSASTGASAIQAEGPLLEVTNTTFADNNAQASATIKTAGSTVATIRYSTIYSNDGAGTNTSGGIWHGNATANSLSLFGNLIMANKRAGVDQNIYAPNASIKDLGYNLLGYGGASYVTGTFTKKATTVYPVEGEADVVVGYGYHGGLRESVKIKKSSPAYNKVPNDGIAFYGVGKSAQYPFTSLSQAHGALKSVKGYDAGVYFFDLGGSYDTGLNPIPGIDSNGVFSTFVDDNGYVLVASADMAANSAAYVQTSNLDQRTDAILKSSVFTHANFDVGEVRISSYSGGARGTFDGYSVSVNLINKIKAFQTLPNTAETGGAWVVTKSSSGINYFTGVARAAGDQNKSLAQEIFYANNAANANGISWVPLSGKEALANISNSSSANFDELDLWVRGNNGLCSGSLTNVDARGLPRADRVQADESVSSCDIGAFEFNDYFTLDCVDEDGLRPENTSSAYQVSFCFSDPSKLNPKNILDNVGALSPVHLLMLMLLGAGLGRSRRQSC